MKQWLCRIVGVAWACAAFAARADAAEGALKRFLDGVQTLDAHFEQMQTDDRGKSTGTSSGHLWLARPPPGKGVPGKFRWAYEKPYEQLSICDGEQLWSYDPDLKQATVRNAREALRGTPAALLSQRGALSEAFTVADAGPEGTAHLVKLTPKSKDSDFKSIELAIEASGAPTRMRFKDQIGGTSEIDFSDIKLNTKIDPAEFRFMPPKGVEIVHGDAPTTTPEQ